MFPTDITLMPAVALVVIVALALWAVLALRPSRDDDPADLYDGDANETLRLAYEIADEAARCDIESECHFETMGRNTWYDSRAQHTHEPHVHSAIDRALRYLRLRHRIVTHPMQTHLVRFRKDLA